MSRVSTARLDRGASQRCYGAAARAQIPSEEQWKWLRMQPDNVCEKHHLRKVQPPSAPSKGLAPSSPPRPATTSDFTTSIPLQHTTQSTLTSHALFSAALDAHSTLLPLLRHPPLDIPPLENHAQLLPSRINRIRSCAAPRHTSALFPHPRSARLTMKPIPRVAQPVPSPQRLRSVPLPFVDVCGTDEGSPVLDGVGSVKGEGDERARGGVLHLRVGGQLVRGRARKG